MPSQRPPRRGIATMRLDLDFFDDAGVQSLYEDHPADEADAAVVLFVRMMIRAHRLDRPDVLEEFQRSKSERRKASLATLANAGLLDEQGIKPESFEMWRTPDRGAYDSERGRAGGIARATSAERDHAGRMLPLDQRKTSVDQRSEPGSVRFGTVRSGAGSGALAREGLPSLTPEAIEALEERTGRPWSQAGDKQLGEYDRLVGDHGLTAVLEALDRVRDGRMLTARQLIWPSLKILEPFAALDTRQDQKQAAADEREAEIKSDVQRRMERTQLELHFQHTVPTEHPACPACREVAS